MAQRKKKSNGHQSQKQEIAQYKNDFFKRLDTFCKSVTGEDLLKLIPVKEKEMIYRFRSRAITAEVEEGHEIPQEIIDSLKGLINSCLKRVEIVIDNTDKKVSLSDYYYFGFPLYIHTVSISEMPYKGSEKVLALLSRNCGDLSFLAKAMSHCFQESIFPFFIIVSNNICHRYFSFRLEASTDANHRATFKIIIRKYPSEKILVELNNNKRPAFRLGWTFGSDSFEWLHITPAQLGINTSFGNLPIPVYIQMHALSRLLERLDCFTQTDIQFSIYKSISNCYIIRDNDKILIEFKAFDIKVGYLSAILTEGKLVIRTFLFLTCMGTPEGKRIESLVGLVKTDSKYLQMDKLSTFMSADISSNKELRQIFEKADCLHLLELYDNLKEFVSEKRRSSHIDILPDYLQTNDVELNNWVDEEINEEKM